MLRKTAPFDDKPVQRLYFDGFRRMDTASGVGIETLDLA